MATNNIQTALKGGLTMLCSVHIRKSGNYIKPENEYYLSIKTTKYMYN